MKNNAFKAIVAFILIIASVGFKTERSFTTNVSNSDSVRASSTIIYNDFKSIYQKIGLKSIGLSEDAFRYAWLAYKQGTFKKSIVAIADFSQSSCKKRLYIIDLKEETLLYNTYVAHGRNSGLEYARTFSNQSSSYQSSLGFYRTLDTYQGKHGLSLKLEGLEYGINHKAADRAIVMHGADYVSENFIHQTGRLGRSQGCPAVSMQDAPKLIKLLANGAGVFLYYPDPQYIKASSFIVKNV